MTGCTFLSCAVLELRHRHLAVGGSQNFATTVLPSLPKWKISSYLPFTRRHTSSSSHSTVKPFVAGTSVCSGIGHLASSSCGQHFLSQAFASSLTSSLITVVKQPARQPESFFTFITIIISTLSAIQTFSTPLSPSSQTGNSKSTTTGL